MRLTTGDLYNSFIPEWFEYHRRERRSRATMARSTKSTSTIAENVTISRQVQRMITATTNLLKMTHFLHILRWILKRIIHDILLCLQLLPGTNCINFLIIKREHLLRLLIILTHLLHILLLLILLMIQASIALIVVTHVVVCLTKSI